MRLIHVSNDPVDAVAVSPDGRSLAVIAGASVFVFDWDGRRVMQWNQRAARQLAFSPDSQWLAVGGFKLVVWRVGESAPTTFAPPGVRFEGGIGFTSDGKHLFASQFSVADVGERMGRWAVPQWKQVDAFSWWPPFPRLAVSPDGQYIGGVSPSLYELRIAVTGGVNKRLVMEYPTHSAFTAFSPDSTHAVAGWDNELHVIETLGGRRVHQLVSKDGPFRDVAYTGSGRHLVTVDESGAAKFWNPMTWVVERVYNWDAGPLTCVACTADGLAAACGTASGQVLLFDVDE